MSLWSRLLDECKAQGGVVPTPDPVEDWRPDHSEWVMRSSCHCGHVIEGTHFSPDVCPECGCQGVPIEEVGRDEWEVDVNFKWLPYMRILCPDADKRNRHWVAKPEGCQKGME